MIREQKDKDKKKGERYWKEQEEYKKMVKWEEKKKEIDGGRVWEKGGKKEGEYEKRRMENEQLAHK